jgi:hypothetical protein
MTTTTTRPLWAIADDIAHAAREHRVAKGTRPSWYSYAEPYVDAMACLTSIDEDYGADSGRSVVLYCLSNLTSWRGDTARAVKAELKSIAGIK